MSTLDWCPIYINKEEEKDLAEFLKKTASIDYDKLRKQVMAIAEMHASSKVLRVYHKQKGFH